MPAHGQAEPSAPRRGCLAGLAHAGLHEHDARAGQLHHELAADLGLGEGPCRGRRGEHRAAEGGVRARAGHVGAGARSLAEHLAGLLATARGPGHGLDEVAERGSERRRLRRQGWGAGGPHAAATGCPWARQPLGARHAAEPHGARAGAGAGPRGRGAGREAPGAGPAQPRPAGPGGAQARRGAARAGKAREAGAAALLRPGAQRQQEHHLSGQALVRPRGRPPARRAGCPASTGQRRT
mmetsp:Transcript_61729/g.198957  ORF Transcript_61729/g.198957 Transcript_61729/m.198957 type:complete len:239 (-) Transcript_61729:9-725(-)